MKRWTLVAKAAAVLVMGVATLATPTAAQARNECEGCEVSCGAAYTRCAGCEGRPLAVCYTGAGCAGVAYYCDYEK